jgi:hypothetical protein
MVVGEDAPRGGREGCGVGLKLSWGSWLEKCLAES